jgi:di/tricarboxylate transporter
LRRIPGILAENKQVDKLKLHKTDRRLIQAVVAVQSPLIGNTVRDARFRTQFDAVIIAVQRSGGRIQAKIGDIVLMAGDVLLLDTGSSFLKLYKSDPAFALVSEIENSAPPQFEKLLPACGTAVVMIIVFVVGALDLFVAALLASGVMLATGCLTQNAARKSVKWEVITTIAAAFGISAAMEQSGVAGEIADTLVTGAASTGSGTVGVLIAVYIATFFLCNVVGNNAAAALMYPIAAGAAEGQGVDRDQMSFLLMLAASASFMSPFGYQTNLMVYGPGGYVFADFLRFGVPMQVVQMIVSVGVVLLGDLWWVGWVAGFGAIACIYGGRAAAAALATRAETAKTGAPPSAKKLDGIREEDETVVDKGPNMV